MMMAKDGEVALFVSTSIGDELLIFLGSHESQVADPMIEARWGIATNLGHLKTTMGLDVLKGKTVHGVLKELMVCALIDHLVRLVMGHAARRQHVAIDRISFIDALRWLGTAQDDELFPTLVVTPHRPGRYEPRVRKRRPKPYPLMTKPRGELRNLLVNNATMD